MAIEASNIKRRFALFVDRVDQLARSESRRRTRSHGLVAADHGFAHLLHVLRSQHKNGFSLQSFETQLVKRNGRLERKHDATSTRSPICCRGNPQRLGFCLKGATTEKQRTCCAMWTSTTLSPRASGDAEGVETSCLLRTR
jgi:hypothetical protein